ncbi:mucin-20 [Carettochelys insculpta]|uniref:mucin-20 n=1 Tax=Carettochelys insculpta TaxID=44489 RepID=UPI003EC10646
MGRPGPWGLVLLLGFLLNLEGHLHGSSVAGTSTAPTTATGASRGEHVSTSPPETATTVAENNSTSSLSTTPSGSTAGPRQPSALAPATNPTAQATETPAAAITVPSGLLSPMPDGSRPQMNTPETETTTGSGELSRSASVPAGTLPALDRSVAAESSTATFGGIISAASSSTTVSIMSSAGAHPTIPSSLREERGTAETARTTPLTSPGEAMPIAAETTTTPLPSTHPGEATWGPGTGAGADTTRTAFPVSTEPGPVTPLHGSADPKATAAAAVTGTSGDTAPAAGKTPAANNSPTTPLSPPAAGSTTNRGPPAAATTPTPAPPATAAGVTSAAAGTRAPWATPATAPGDTAAWLPTTVVSRGAPVTAGPHGTITEERASTETVTESTATPAVPAPADATRRRTPTSTGESAPATPATTASLEMTAARERSTAAPIAATPNTTQGAVPSATATSPPALVVLTPPRGNTTALQTPAEAASTAGSSTETTRKADSPTQVLGTAASASAAPAPHPTGKGTSTSMATASPVARTTANTPTTNSTTAAVHGTTIPAGTTMVHPLAAGSPPMAAAGPKVPPGPTPAATAREAAAKPNATAPSQVPDVPVEEQRTALPTCHPPAANAAGAVLFLSVGLTTHLNLSEPSTQHMLVSKLEQMLRMKFPCGFTVLWKGESKTEEGFGRPLGN